MENQNLQSQLEENEPANDAGSLSVREGSKPGPEPILTESLSLEIRKQVLAGEDYIKIQANLNINPSTWDRWVWLNYKEFRTDLIKWKKERMIRESERVMSRLVYSEDENIQFKSSSFLLETIGKDEGYTKRVENTGKDGRDLIPQPILGDVQTNDSNKENSEAPEADQSNTRGNVSIQDDLNPIVIDQPSAAEAGADPNLDSVGELSSPQEGGNEGLPIDNGDTPILQGQSLE